MSLKSILLSLLVFMACYYWLKSRDLKEHALKSAKKYCQDLDLTLLDETVVLGTIGIRRNMHGRLCLMRCYRFEFSATGEDRYEGSVTLMGKQITSMKLAPHRMQ